MSARDPIDANGYPAIRRFASRVALILAMLLTATGCAALATALGFAQVAAPVAVSVLDAYAETARAIAPAASTQDLTVLADLLRKRDECSIAATVATAPDAGPTDARQIVETSRALAEAAHELATAIEALRSRDGGVEGGGA